MEILKEVLTSNFCCPSFPSYSEVYFITPLLIAPLAKVNANAIKFVKAPISATPPGPVYMATTLLAIKPDANLIRVIIAEKNEVFTNFKIINIYLKPTPLSLFLHYSSLGL